MGMNGWVNCAIRLMLGATTRILTILHVLLFLPLSSAGTIKFHINQYNRLLLPSTASLFALWPELLLLPVVTFPSTVPF